MGSPFAALVCGFVMSFVGSMPVAGPIAVLVLERSLYGDPAAIRIALGSAIAEAAYALLACLGAGAVLERFPLVGPASRLVGAAILVGLGITLALRSTPDRAPAELPARIRTRGFLAGLLINLMNPTIIVTWTAAVTAAHSIGILRIGTPGAFAFALGAAAGVVGWFAVLLRLVARFQRAIEPRTIDRMVRVVGWLIAGAGAAVGLRQVF